MVNPLVRWSTLADADDKGRDLPCGWQIVSLGIRYLPRDKSCFLRTSHRELSPRSTRRSTSAGQSWRWARRSRISGRRLESSRSSLKLSEMKCCRATDLDARWHNCAGWNVRRALLHRTERQTFPHELALQRRKLLREQRRQNGAGDQLTAAGGSPSHSSGHVFSSLPRGRRPQDADRRDDDEDDDELHQDRHPVSTRLDPLVPRLEVQRHHACHKTRPPRALPGRVGPRTYRGTR